MTLIRKIKEKRAALVQRILAGQDTDHARWMKNNQACVLAKIAARFFRRYFSIF